MKILKVLLTVIILSSSAMLTGCSNQNGKKTIKQINLPDTTKQQAIDAAEKVLRKMNFTIAKTDIERGFIKTKPLAGAQFFEFWRSDNVGAFNNAEASMHTIRRTVELNINTQNGQLSIDCFAKVQRLNVPELDVTNSTRAFAMFSKSGESKQVLKFNQEQEDQVYWTDLGNDEKLASKILRQIEKQITKL